MKYVPILEVSSREKIRKVLECEKSRNRKKTQSHRRDLKWSAFGYKTAYFSCEWVKWQKVGLENAFRYCILMSKSGRDFEVVVSLFCVYIAANHLATILLSIA